MIFSVKYTQRLYRQKQFPFMLIRTVLEKSRLVIRTHETSGRWIRYPSKNVRLIPHPHHRAAETH